MARRRGRGASRPSFENGSSFVSSVSIVAGGRERRDRAILWASSRGRGASRPVDSVGNQLFRVLHNRILMGRIVARKLFGTPIGPDVIVKAECSSTGNAIIVAIVASIVGAIAGAIAGAFLKMLLDKCCALQQCEHCTGKDQTVGQVGATEPDRVSSGGPQEEPHSQTAEALNETAGAVPCPILVPSGSFREVKTTVKHRRSRSGQSAGGTEAGAVPPGVSREEARSERLDEIKELNGESLPSPRLDTALLLGANDRSWKGGREQDLTS